MKASTRSPLSPSHSFVDVLLPVHVAHGDRRTVYLDPMVRIAHTAPLAATGTFRVDAAERLAGRVVACLAGLPRPGTDVPIDIEVSLHEGRQTWRRRFGTALFVTRQWIEQGLLVEARGPARIGMRLSAENGALHYRTERTWLWTCPLPAGLAPVVEARVQAAGNAWRIDVTISHALLGLLCRYGGTMTLTAGITPTEGIQPEGIHQ